METSLHRKKKMSLNPQIEGYGSLRIIEGGGEKRRFPPQYV